MLSSSRMALLVLVALGALLAAELEFARHAVETTELQPTPAAAPPERDPGEAAFALPEPESFGQISERPLFVAGRRPPDTAKPAPQPSQPAKPAPQRPPDFVLSAVVRERSRWVAFVGTQRNADPVQVEVGSIVAGWKVERIDTGGIVLRRGDRTTQLSLRSY